MVGEPGLAALEQRLPGLVRRYGGVFTVVNGENAAGGFGLTAETLDRILAAGADVVSSGNHVWEKRDFWPLLEGAKNPGGKPVLRPANYHDAPGTGWLRLSKAAAAGPFTALAVNLQGRERMAATDCPFRCFDRIFAEAEQNAGAGGDAGDAAAGQNAAETSGTGQAGPAAGASPAGPVIIVDFHAESSEEKEALAYYLDGRASIVAGTHTHVQTTDERILPGGTAYITDLGMTGAMNGVIGMEPGICLDRARTQIQFRMECARPQSDADLKVQGIAVELDKNGRAISIERFSV